MRITARKTGVGAVSLAVLVGLATGPSVTASAVTGSGSAPQQAAAATKAAPDELPNAFEDKRRALRSEALQDLLKGTKKAEKRGASTVVNLGKADAAPQASLKKGGKAAKAAKSQYVELAREKTDKIFVVLAEFGDQRAPELPGPGHGPEHPRARRRSTARCTTRSPQPDRSGDNSTVWQPDYDQAHFQELYFGDGQGRRVAEDVLREAVLGPLQRRRPGLRLGQGPYNEARYGRSNGYPCAGNVCSNTLVPDRGRARRVGRRPEGQGPHRRADQGRPGVVRPVGPLRLRRRRQLQRARRLHRPLPDRPRRRRPGRRRPAPGRGRHLEPPLVRLPEHQPPARRSNKRGGTQIGNTGLWVGDYTIQPENGGSTSSPRVRPRPRPAGPLRHLGSAQPEPRQLVDAHGAEPRSAPRATRASAPRAADLGAWDKLQLGWLDYEIVVAGQDKNARPRPARVQQHQGPGRRRGPAEEAGHDRRSSPPAAGTKSWWSGAGDDLEHLADALGDPARRRPGHAVVPGPLEHRGLRPRRV